MGASRCSIYCSSAKIDCIEHSRSKTSVVEPVSLLSLLRSTSLNMTSKSASPPPPPRPPKPVVVPFLLTLALFCLVAIFTLAPSTRLFRKPHRLIIRPIATLLGRIPLPSAFDAPSNLAVSIKSYSSYSNDQQFALDRKLLAYERMSARHRRIGTKLGWPGVLEKAEDALDLNSKVTDELAAIGLELARKEGIPTGFNLKMRKESGRVVEVGFTSNLRTLSHFLS